MGYVGLMKDNALSGKKCLSKFKNKHFLEVVHVGTSPERQVAVVIKLWTMVPNIFAPYPPSSALHFEVFAMLVGDFSTPDLSCNYPF